MSAVISFEHVSYAYGHSNVLEDINVDIEAEEFFGVIGPNAAGKSTMLKLMLGMLNPAKGKISVMGKSPRQACQQIGYVPQFPSFPRNFPINVEDVVLLGRMGRRPRALRLLEELAQHPERQGLAVVRARQLWLAPSPATERCN